VAKEEGKMRNSDYYGSSNQYDRENMFYREEEELYRELERLRAEAEADPENEELQKRLRELMQKLGTKSAGIKAGGFSASDGMEAVKAASDDELQRRLEDAKKRVEALVSGGTSFKLPKPEYSPEVLAALQGAVEDIKAGMKTGKGQAADQINGLSGPDEAGYLRHEADHSGANDELQRRLEEATKKVEEITGIRMTPKTLPEIIAGGDREEFMTEMKKQVENLKRDLAQNSKKQEEEEEEEEDSDLLEEIPLDASVPEVEEKEYYPTVPGNWVAASDGRENPTRLDAGSAPGDGENQKPDLLACGKMPALSGAKETTFDRPLNPKELKTFARALLMLKFAGYGDEANGLRNLMVNDKVLTKEGLLNSRDGALGLYERRKIYLDPSLTSNPNLLKFAPLMDFNYALKTAGYSLHEYFHKTKSLSEKRAWNKQIEFYQALLSKLNPNDPRVKYVKYEIDDAIWQRNHIQEIKQ